MFFFSVIKFLLFPLVADDDLCLCRLLDMFHTGHRSRHLDALGYYTVGGTKSTETAIFLFILENSVDSEVNQSFSSSSSHIAGRGPLHCLRIMATEVGRMRQHGRSVVAVPAELVNPLDFCSTTRASPGRMITRWYIKMGGKDPMSWDILISLGNVVRYGQSAFQ